MGLIALGALTVTSCSNDEVMDAALQQEAKAIQFSTYLGRDVETKGAVFGDPQLQSQGFGVFALYTENGVLSASTATSVNFMNNTKVTNSGSGWTYSPIKYWPNNPGDKVSFFAYAPYNASLAPTLTAGVLTVPFTVNNTVEDQIDFLWNNAAVTDQTKPNTSATIDFKFQHALSRIGFTVSAAVDEVELGSKVLDENTKIELKQVVISKDEEATPSGVFYTTANLKLNNTTESAVWTGETGTQYFTLEPTNFEGNNKITLNKDNSKDANKVNNNDSYIMIIPQTTAFDVYVEYDVITTDPSGSDHSTITNKIHQTVSELAFKSGKAYTFHLVLGMTSVKVTGDVQVWDEQTEQKVDVPENSAS